MSPLELHAGLCCKKGWSVLWVLGLASSSYRSMGSNGAESYGVSLSFAKTTYSSEMRLDYSTLSAWESLNLVRGAMAVSPKNSPDFNRPAPGSERLLPGG